MYPFERGKSLGARSPATLRVEQRHPADASEPRPGDAGSPAAPAPRRPKCVFELGVFFHLQIANGCCPNKQLRRQQLRI